MTPQEERKYLEEKIVQVKQDIEGMRQVGSADKKLETLVFYQEYLEDELKMLREKLNGIRP